MTYDRGLGQAIAGDGVASSVPRQAMRRKMPSQVEFELEFSSYWIDQDEPDS